MLEMNGVGACLHPIYLVSIHESVSFCKNMKLCLLERATSNFFVISSRLYLSQIPLMTFSNLLNQCVGSVICKGHAAGCAPCYFCSFFISWWVTQIFIQKYVLGTVLNLLTKMCANGNIVCTVP